MKYLNRRAQKEISDWVRANFQEVEVYPGDYIGNLNCHINAVNKAFSYQNDISQTVAITVAICEDDQPIIHFVNAKSSLVPIPSFYGPTEYREHWYYTDNTLGIWCENRKHYLIRIIPRCNLLGIDKDFENLRKDLGRILNPITRLLSDYRG